FSTVADFRTRYLNRRKTIKKDGEDKSKRLADWWLEHEHRAECDKVVFAPGKTVSGAYNLWRGFTGTTEHGDSAAQCSVYLPRIHDNIWQNNKELYDYVIR